MKIKTIVVDDEPWMLRGFAGTCQSVEELDLVGSFRGAKQALEFAESNDITLAFLDVEMPGMDGIALANSLREKQPDIRIVLVSAYDYSTVAARRGPLKCGYLMKPYSTETLRKAMSEQMDSADL